MITSLPTNNLAYGPLGCQQERGKRGLTEVGELMGEFSFIDMIRQNAVTGNVISN